MASKKKQAAEEVSPSPEEVESNVEQIKEVGPAGDVEAEPIPKTESAPVATDPSKYVVGWLVCELKDKETITEATEAWPKGEADRYLASHTASAYMFLEPVLVDPDDRKVWVKIRK